MKQEWMKHIQCDHCGQWIPYDGQVCPFCGANKERAKREDDLTRDVLATGCLGMLGGCVIGGMVSMSIASILGWGFGLCVAGVVLVVLGARREK